ncbi:MAG: NRDE family protein [Phycisphaerae bacterium]|nr:NRDE family protein [Phycisphaerae bacterium]
MCTVTVAGLAARGDGRAGLRVVCNRDESRLRPAAAPPRLVAAGARTALMPMDPPSGGTWAAGTDAGLALCLLNANPPGRRAEGRSGARSRGAIVPAAAAGGSVEEALALTRSLPLEAFEPFTLLIADAARLAVLWWDGRAASLERPGPVHAARMFTSSGLGDALVTPARRALFERMVLGAAGAPAAVDAFHRHQWAHAPERSVQMSRAEARTVCRTVLEVSARGVSVRYAEVREDGQIGAGVERLIGVREGALVA